MADKPENKKEKFLFLKPDDTAFLEACGISWGDGAYTAEKMKSEGIWVLVGTIEVPASQPPRSDGLDRLPPVPANHFRVRTSDGGLWDVPADRIEEARNRDPGLQILNPW